MNKIGKATATDGLSIGQLASMACLMEVTAVKPGNVHRGADFEDATYFDFAASTIAIAPAFERAAIVGVGRTVLDAAQATRRVVETNTNLGTLLLLAPLAAVPRHESLREGVASVLKALTPDDARLVYEAIRTAQPGGMGQQAEADVAGDAPDDLLHAMRLASDRDLVARQYVNGFDEVFNLVVSSLEDGIQRGWSLEKSIVHAHLRLMAKCPDSLIARKCGDETARKASSMAARVLAAGELGDAAYERALGDLDFWMRSDHHRRNPGTSADLVAAGIFVVLREGVVRPPYGLYD